MLNMSCSGDLVCLFSAAAVEGEGVVVVVVEEEEEDDDDANLIGAVERRVDPAFLYG